MDTNQENKADHSAEDGIEWDNGEATYGHKLPGFKPKNAPADDHLQQVNENVNEKLQNQNLSQEEDIANRNQDNEKGIDERSL